MKKFLLIASSVFMVSALANLEVPKNILSIHQALCPDITESEIYPEVMELGHGKKLYLLTCELYAYNSSQRAYTLDAYSAIEPLALIDLSVSNQMYASSRLMGAGLSVENKEIHTFQKGRGIGDCGSSAIYAYDSEIDQFVLKEYRLKSECDGEVEAEWPIIYPKK